MGKSDHYFFKGMGTPPPPAPLAMTRYGKPKGQDCHVLLPPWMCGYVVETGVDVCESHKDANMGEPM